MPGTKTATPPGGRTRVSVAITPLNFGGERRAQPERRVLVIEPLVVLVERHYAIGLSDALGGTFEVAPHSTRLADSQSCANWLLRMSWGRKEEPVRAGLKNLPDSKLYAVVRAEIRRENWLAAPRGIRHPSRFDQIPHLMLPVGHAGNRVQVYVVR